ncbi:uncharacterized protein EV422DRAFT_539034 [Fimicolochytrium jonesii]|uniref:uncharacterized protein n=1 Tax=Fimicolochytrium jonesii TaxID=1396493 RepID=UPI0022FE8F35|nr:uncharacterized protein EV422DRAFT_539034 [Fimicolochytrium jonesii]KAI8818199.1 hypothetical protein EV422DRAFT_539034 [Fimicolochytrium jonesii]
MPVTYHLDKIAYLKLVLHATKYAVSGVTGVLIGTKAADDNIEVTDAIPLFHSHPLAPTLEVALQQIQIHCNQLSLAVVGFYCANQLESDKEVSPVVAKIATKIDDNLGGGALLLVWDSAKFRSEKSFAVTPRTLTSGGSWTLLQSNYLLPATPSIDVSPFIKQRLYEHIADFDNHLDDTKLDWLRNEKVVEIAGR